MARPEHSDRTEHTAAPAPRQPAEDPTDPAVPNRVARRISSGRVAHLGDDTTPRVVGVLKDGASIVASLRGLYVVDDEGLVHSTPWYEIDHAGFESETNTLRVRLVDQDAEQWRLPLDGNVADVATAVKERVDASVVHLEQFMLTDGTRARVVLRKDADGRLFTQRVLVGGGTPGEADEHRIALAEERVRQTVGL